LLFLSNILQYSFSCLYANYFNDNMPHRGSILFKSILCTGGFLYWMDNWVLGFRNFFAIILLNILHVPLVCTSSLSSMPIIPRFGLLMESQNSYIFLQYLLSLLSKSFSVFFFNIYFIYEPWDSVCHLF
jgi:hypothetical protein